METPNRIPKIIPTGQCTNCFAVNALTAQNCIECGEKLPWADAVRQPASLEITSQGRSRTRAHTPSPSERGKVKAPSFLPWVWVISLALNVLICFPTYQKQLAEQHQYQVARQSVVKTSQARIKKFFITAEDLRHGELQVDLMMRDRPAMAQWVKKGDVIYSWAAHKFAGESVGQRVYWSPDFLPTIPMNSYNTPSTPQTPGSISIRLVCASGESKGQKLGSEELWACAIFELFNISNWPEWNAAYNAALTGKISKKEFVEKMTHPEYFTAINTGEFYKTIWRPWAHNTKASCHAYHWQTDVPNTYEEWIQQYPDSSDYLTNYRKYYDQLMLDRAVTQ